MPLGDWEKVVNSKRFLFALLGFAPVSVQAEKSIDAKNFVYQGCIRSPVELEIADLTFYPSGDPGGSGDGYPGSLYLLSSGTSGSEKALEISIPAPAIAGSPSSCPAATVRRNLTTIGCNLDPMENEAMAGGIAYYNDLGGVGEKLYWTVFEYYNADGDDHDSAGWMNLDLSGCAGAWGMTGTGGVNSDDNSEPYHSHQWEDFIFEIHDKAWADAHLGGRYLIYGRHKEAGCCGGATGPSLYAAAPWNDGNPIPNNGNMNGQIMLSYSGTYDLPNSHYFPALFGDPEYRSTDRFSGAAWVRVGTEDAIVITGRKSLGQSWYGFGGNGCSTHQGFHGDPYGNRWWFYDPSDLECAIAGTCNTWNPVPYAVYDSSGETFSDDCFNDVEAQGGAAFDDANDLFYFAETTWSGSAFVPVIHVYRVNGSSANNTRDVAKTGNGFGTITGSQR